MKLFVPRKGEELNPIIQDGSSRIIVAFLLNNEDNFKKNFRCINCGKIVFQYAGEIVSVFDGAKPIEGKDIDVMCGRCKIMYRTVSC